MYANTYIETAVDKVLEQQTITDAVGLEVNPSGGPVSWMRHEHGTRKEVSQGPLILWPALPADVLGRVVKRLLFQAGAGDRQATVHQLPQERAASRRHDVLVGVDGARLRRPGPGGNSGGIAERVDILNHIDRAQRFSFATLLGRLCVHLQVRAMKNKGARNKRRGKK